VPDAVRVCKRAGITVRMVTGDNTYTAQHIARECGILSEGGLALEGPDFRNRSDEELKEVLPSVQVRSWFSLPSLSLDICCPTETPASHLSPSPAVTCVACCTTQCISGVSHTQLTWRALLQVLARSSPADKFKLVHLLKEMGEVVAVTGDGTNDAPALKESDVGLAMGIAGTEVPSSHGSPAGRCAWHVCTPSLGCTAPWVS
jgi:magnesium-transporting ATPase (P-type)